jgi:group I intron endonuclease
MKTGYIYTLSDPLTKEIRYVGQTINNPSKRLAQHIHQEKRSKGRLTHVNSWIRNLKKEGCLPVLEIIDECEIEELNNKEIYYIAELKKKYNLCNHSEGGVGCRGIKHSEESKQKRLLTLKTSKAWAEKHKKHSLIMKEKYKKGGINFGYKYLPLEKRKEIGKNHSNTMKKLFKNDPSYSQRMVIKIIKPVCLLSADGFILKVYRSASEAARSLNIKDSTHVTRVCKKKSKHAFGYRFAYLKEALY